MLSSWLVLVVVRGRDRFGRRLLTRKRHVREVPEWLARKGERVSRRTAELTFFTFRPTRSATISNK